MFPGDVAALKHCAEIINNVRNLVEAEIERLREFRNREDFPNEAYLGHLNELKKLSDWTSDTAQAAILERPTKPEKHQSQIVNRK